MNERTEMSCKNTADSWNSYTAQARHVAEVARASNNFVVGSESTTRSHVEAHCKVGSGPSHLRDQHFDVRWAPGEKASEVLACAHRVAARVFGVDWLNTILSKTTSACVAYSDDHHIGMRVHNGPGDGSPLVTVLTIPQGMTLKAGGEIFGFTHPLLARDNCSAHTNSAYKLQAPLGHVPEGVAVYPIAPADPVCVGGFCPAVAPAPCADGSCTRPWGPSPMYHHAAPGKSRRQHKGKKH